MNLKHLTDQILLQDIKKLAAAERNLTVKMLYHLLEIERRRLFSELKYTSLYEYVVKELKYSSPAASRRIRSARILGEFPFLEQEILDGRLTLTHLSLATHLFKEEKIDSYEKRKAILSKIENTTTRDCEKILSGFKANPDLPAETMEVVSPNITTVKFNLTDETLKIFGDIKAILAHHRYSNDELLNQTFKAAFELFTNKRFKVNAKFTTAQASPGITRYVPAMTKKLVFERDKGRCVKCGSRYKLQYDHIKPFSEGGETKLENLRLLCFSCNQRRLKPSINDLGDNHLLN